MNFDQLGVLGVFFWCSGSEKGVFWKRGLSRKVHSLEVLENFEILEILNSPVLLFLGVFVSFIFSCCEIPWSF